MCWSLERFDFIYVPQYDHQHTLNIASKHNLSTYDVSIIDYESGNN